MSHSSEKEQVSEQVSSGSVQIPRKKIIWSPDEEEIVFSEVIASFSTTLIFVFMTWSKCLMEKRKHLSPLICLLTSFSSSFCGLRCFSPFRQASVLQAQKLQKFFISFISLLHRRHAFFSHCMMTWYLFWIGKSMRMCSAMCGGICAKKHC